MGQGHPCLLMKGFFWVSLVYNRKIDLSLKTDASIAEFWSADSSYWNLWLMNLKLINGPAYITSFHRMCWMTRRIIIEFGISTTRVSLLNHYPETFLPKFLKVEKFYITRYGRVTVLKKFSFSYGNLVILVWILMISSNASHRAFLIYQLPYFIFKAFAWLVSLPNDILSVSHTILLGHPFKKERDSMAYHQQFSLDTLAWEEFVHLFWYQSGLWIFYLFGYLYSSHLV